MPTANVKRLNGVHPVLIEKVTRILTAMEALGHPMLATDGVRTAEMQAFLYAQGRTRPGKIVTWADGLAKKSNHQVKKDGFGHAVDCCFLVDIDGDGPDDPSWADKHPWSFYGAAARLLGLTWGGDWESFVDKPHIELPE